MSQQTQWLLAQANKIEKEERSTQHRYWVLMAILIFLVVLVCGDLLVNPELSGVGALAFFFAIFFGYWLMRKGDELRDLSSEKLEYVRLGLLKPNLDEAQSDASNAAIDVPEEVANEIAMRQRTRIVRNRARYAEMSGILLGSFALTLLMWFGFSLPVFLEEYAAAPDKSAPKLWEDELELISIALLGFILLGWAISRIASGRSARQEVERLEIEAELLPVKYRQEVQRSRKLLLINQNSLTRYYQNNRFNNRVSVLVAVFCVVAGLGFSIWAISEIVAADTNAQGKLLAAGVGAANAVMINVVAAVVLRLQSTVSANVSAFHDRLVHSHDILLANVIASEIDDDIVRRETLAAIAKTIGTRNSSSGGSEKTDAKAEKKK